MSEEEIARIVIDTMKYYKNKKTAKELEEVPIDILRFMYLELLYKVEQLEKENEELKEDNCVYHDIINRQNKREYRSKFLKEFQEEYGACVYPDYDEIYKRYYNVKNNSIPKSKIIEKIEELGEKQKATKDMCKSLALSTARTTLAELIGLDNMVDLFQGCDTLIKLNESGGSNGI